MARSERKLSEDAKVIDQELQMIAFSISNTILVLKGYISDPKSQNTSIAEKFLTSLQNTLAEVEKLKLTFPTLLSDPEQSHLSLLIHQEYKNQFNQLMSQLTSKVDETLKIKIGRVPFRHPLSDADPTLSKILANTKLMIEPRETKDLKPGNK